MRSLFLLGGVLLIFWLTVACQTAVAPPTPPPIRYLYDDIPPVAEQSAAATQFLAISRWHKYQLSYRFTNTTAKLPGETELDIVRQALAIWSEHTPFVFTELSPSNPATADILIGWYDEVDPTGHPFDGPSGRLLHVTLPNPLLAHHQATLFFDGSEAWADSLTEGIDLLTVALHGVGHLLGLGHSRHPYAVMYHHYTGARRTLTPDDVAAIGELYGPYSSAVAPAVPPIGASVPASPGLDTDGDGLSDMEERFMTGTDPHQRDTDGDGLPDGLEMLYRMNPLDPDMDRDGLTDGEEFRTNRNPFFPNQFPHLGQPAVPIDSELLATLNELWQEAIWLETRALRRGTAAELPTLFGADALAPLAEQITLNQQLGQTVLPQFQPYHSWVAEVRPITPRHVEMDVCEAWSQIAWDEATGEVAWAVGRQVQPRTIVWRWLDVGWRITAVTWFDTPRFCSEK